MFRLLFVIAFLVLSSCQSPPSDEELSRQKVDLENQLAQARQKIASMEQRSNALHQEKNELQRVMAILSTEKTSRVEESSELRSQVRKFTQQQIDALKEFLVKSKLLDYVGEELLDRSILEADAGVIVDLDNAVPRNGSLMGVTGYFIGESELQVYILRPVNGQNVVIWKSKLLRITAPGVRRVRFPVSVGVEQGDIIAYEFPQSIAVKFDKGTGNSLLSQKSFNLGQSVPLSSLKARNDRRAYSLGVIGILE